MIPGVVDSAGGKVLGAFTDDFNRADSTDIYTTAIRWKEIIGDWEISSNRLTTSTPVASNPIAAVRTNAKNVQVEVGKGADGFGWGVAFWALDANNWYIAVCEMTSSIGYYCPTNTAVVTLTGTTCVYPADYPATVSYTCPTNTSVTTLIGTTCTYPSDYSATITGYSCNPGDTRVGTTCTNTTTYAGTPNYTCPSGWTWDAADGKCFRMVTVTYDCNIAATCSAFVDDTGDIWTQGCAGTTSNDGIYLEGCGCFPHEVGQVSTCTCYSNNVTGVCPTQAYCTNYAKCNAYWFNNQCYTTARSGCVYSSTTQTCTSYSCPAGYSNPNDGTCYDTCSDEVREEIEGTISSYSCPTGGTPNNTTGICTKTTTYTATTNYSCPINTSVVTLSGSSCIYPNDYTATTVYTCPINTGVAVPVGATCTYPADYAATSGTNYNHKLVLKRSLNGTVSTLATGSTVSVASSTARPSYVRVVTNGENITVTAPLDDASGTATLSHTATGAKRGSRHGVALSSIAGTQGYNIDNFSYQPL